ncbi:N-acetyltransferase GCN5 [Lysobacter helvus]|uniref:N-acetyltransferase GCN5 n=2 Tax=Lysobacteraceae TaxID=32033 RepID=A0ABM7Q3R7_9GAMM|nr:MULTISPECIES: GNAT family N-acetyltransferase [Lysobacter]BCT91877.1 N-acetyltransferase GCN5 [Lysobacter caseinilyticus]BCT95030.1 N-acetyltransferase GCN5 [Lysobacter helvus]
MGGADASGATIRVRGVEATDAAAVGTLLDVLGYPCTEAEAVGRIAHYRTDDRQFLLLAERDGTPCGLAAVKLNYSLTRGADVARITALVVSPDCHGEGIGRRLLREVESRARKAGAVRLEITSNPSRTGAHAFYHACGYADGSRHFVKLLGD